MEKEIYLEPIKVAYTNSFGHPSTSDAFKRLEEIVPLKGNKFYATYNSKTSEYCACVKINGNEKVKELELPVKTLDEGWYASTEVKGPFLEITRKIGPLFCELAEKFQVDSSRLPIEYYKQHTHIILYLPLLNLIKGI